MLEFVPSIDIDAEKLLSDLCDTNESLNARQTLSTSPFDFFHYFNTEEAKDVVNCHEHVDPGMSHSFNLQKLTDVPFRTYDDRPPCFHARLGNFSPGY